MYFKPELIAQTKTTPAPIATSNTLTALFAATLGFALLFTTGFAEIPAIHNAAHDARHSAGFPCH